MWDPPRPGLEPVSPAWAGGFLTTAPPGKSQEFILVYGSAIFHCLSLCVCVCVYDIFFIHSTGGHLGCFCILAIISNAAMNTGCIYLFKLVFSFSLDKCSEVELLVHMVIQFLIFWGTSIPFSITAAPIYIPTNRAQDFPFLHILTNTCYFLSFW